MDLPRLQLRYWAVPIAVQLQYSMDALHTLCGPLANTCSTQLDQLLMLPPLIQMRFICYESCTVIRSESARLLQQLRCVVCGTLPQLNIFHAIDKTIHVLPVSSTLVS